MTKKTGRFFLRSLMYAGSNNVSFHALWLFYCNKPAFISRCLPFFVWKDDLNFTAIYVSRLLHLYVTGSNEPILCFLWSDERLFWVFFCALDVVLNVRIFKHVSRVAMASIFPFLCPHSAPRNGLITFENVFLMTKSADSLFKPLKREFFSSFF